MHDKYILPPLLVQVATPKGKAAEFWGPETEYREISA
jgi:hypothetical protein